MKDRKILKNLVDQYKNKLKTQEYPNYQTLSRTQEETYITLNKITLCISEAQLHLSLILSLISCKETMDHSIHKKVKINKDCLRAKWDFKLRK